MNKMIPLLIALAVPVSFVGCGAGSNNDPAANVREAAKDRDLQGKIFRGECSLKPLDAIASGIATAGKAAIKSAREQYEIVGANITHATLLYTSTDCTGTESLIFKETGSVDIDTDKHTEDGGNYIDIHMKALTAQATDDAGVLVANDVKLCGINDWSNKESHEVTGNAKDVSCYRKEVPSDDANAYKLDGKTLMFGKKGLFSRDSTRPTEIDTDEKYIAD